MAAGVILSALLLIVAGARAGAPITDYVEFVDLKTVSDLARNTDANYRLNRTVTPSHYDILLDPFFNTGGEDAFTFNGTTTITLQASDSSVQEIILHAVDMTIDTIRLVLNTNPESNIAQSYAFEESYEFLRIRLSENMIPDQNYSLSIQYVGLIQRETFMQGFYRSWYKDSEGNIRWMGTTQFQPGYARRAFPCFDEPFFKAVFEISISRPVSFSNSISNMPIRNTTELGDRELDIFFPTPVTSSYLIGFIVSEYVDHGSQAGDRPFAVYARESALPQGHYAYEVGVDLLAAMDNYTGIDYYSMGENLKLDQAAIPDFSAGAMENWGIMTYREALILHDDALTPSSYKGRIAGIISHEVAHMWFGNLVTCDWWNNLWLNEGFARYFQYFLTHRVEAYMENDVQFVVDQVRTALFADSLPGAHALTYDAVNSPTEVWAMFSTLTYNKGASIIRMIEFLIGSPTFERGLHNYLVEHAYSTTVPSDLYAALDEAAAEDGTLERHAVTVAQVMDSWISKNGYPLITVTVRSNGLLDVSQRRFFRSGDTNPSSDLYSVPLTFTSQAATNWDNMTVEYVLNVRRTTLSAGSDQPGWVIFNKKGSGFYRVHYDSQNWERILTTLNNIQTINQIDQLNRALIVDDWFQLARAEIIPYPTLLRYLQFLEHETSYPVWVNALNGFAFIERRLAHIPDALEILEEFILGLMENVMADVTFTEAPADPHLRKLLRQLVMRTACALGHEECINAAEAAFRAAISVTNPVPLPANSKMWVYCTVLQSGLAGAFDYIWESYGSSNVYNEKIEIIGILGCTRNNEELQRFLNHTFDEDTAFGIRSQDMTTALSSAITGNENNTDVVFEWLKHNDQQVQTYYNGLSGVATVINSLAGRMIYERQIVELEDWVTSRSDFLPLLPTTRAATAAARDNLVWTETKLQSLMLALRGASATFRVSAVLLTLSLVFTVFRQ